MTQLDKAQQRVSNNVGSIEHLCKEAICLADLDLMLALGFPEAASKKLCDIIHKKAAELNIDSLEKHYKKHLKEGTSNIINVIIREFHKLYFATRANLHPLDLLWNVERSYNEDLCAALFSCSMKNKSSVLESRRLKLIERKLKMNLKKQAHCDNTELDLIINSDVVKLFASGE